MRTPLLSYLPLLALAAAAPACGSAAGSGGPSASSDPTSLDRPQAGAPQRFGVDSIQYPDKPADFAVDLNGDGTRDNQLASVLGVLKINQDDPAQSASKLLASGRLAPVIDVTTDSGSLTDDAHVRVRFAEGSFEAKVEGQLAKGTFSTERTFRTSKPATGSVRIPLFADSDPVVLPIVGVALSLRVEDDGSLSGAVHGAIRKADLEANVLPEVHRAFDEMVTSHPELHTSIVRLLDRDGDGKVSFEEFKSSTFVQSFLKMDVQLYDAAGNWAPNAKNTSPDALSLGFGFHAKPAATASSAK